MTRIAGGSSLDVTGLGTPSNLLADMTAGLEISSNLLVDITCTDLTVGRFVPCVLGTLALGMRSAIIDFTRQVHTVAKRVR